MYLNWYDGTFCNVAVSIPTAIMDDVNQNLKLHGLLVEVNLTCVSFLFVNYASENLKTLLFPQFVNQCNETIVEFLPMGTFTKVTC